MQNEIIFILYKEFLFFLLLKTMYQDHSPTSNYPLFASFNYFAFYLQMMAQLPNRGRQFKGKRFNKFLIYIYAIIANLFFTRWLFEGIWVLFFIGCTMSMGTPLTLRQWEDSKLRISDYSHLEGFSRRFFTLEVLSSQFDVPKYPKDRKLYSVKVIMKVTPVTQMCGVGVDAGALPSRSFLPGIHQNSKQ